MKKYYISICVLCSILYSSVLVVSASVPTSVSGVQASIPSGTPNAPIGYEQKGFIGDIISQIFDPIGKIISDYILAFQNILPEDNIIPVWNATTKVFDVGSIRDTGIRVSISSDVGIGTNTPSNKLDVIGTIEGEGIFMRNNVDNFLAGNLGLNTQTPQARVHINDSSDVSLVSNNHAFTIGGHSSTNIAIDSNEILARNDGAGSALYVQHGGGAGNTIFNTNSGDVGIGTLSPTYKLDVNGQIRMRTQTNSSDSDDVVATKGYVDDSIAGFGGGLEILTAEEGFSGMTGTQACESIGKTCKKVISFNYIANDANCPSATHCIRICASSYNKSLPGVEDGSWKDNIHSCNAIIQANVAHYIHPLVVQCNSHYSAYCG